MNTITGFTFYDSLNKLTVGTLLLLLVGGMIGEKAETNIMFFVTAFIGAPDKPCGVGRADANPKLLLNDT